MTMHSIASIRLLKQQQVEWARNHDLVVDDAGYLLSPDHNLPWLTPTIRAAFVAADGHEFGSEAKRGKIAALHSSSALAVNVFGYWEPLNCGPLASVLGVREEIINICFERKFPTGVGTRSPNLDVVIRSSAHSILAIESKFTEPFGSGKKTGIQDKYFPTSRKLWTERGLPGAQRAAETLREGSIFTLLDAPQLLKHLLGLAQCNETWRLLLLWYAPSSEAEISMQREAAEFTDLLGDDAHRFSARTYQDFWSVLTPLLGTPHEKYRQYIDARYFYDRGDQ